VELAGSRVEVQDKQVPSGISGFQVEIPGQTEFQVELVVQVEHQEIAYYCICNSIRLKKKYKI
jgi:uncharacterized Zn finger protein